MTKGVGFLFLTDSTSDTFIKTISMVGIILKAMFPTRYIEVDKALFIGILI